MWSNTVQATLGYQLQYKISWCYVVGPLIKYGWKHHCCPNIAVRRHHIRSEAGQSRQPAHSPLPDALGDAMGATKSYHLGIISVGWDIISDYTPYSPQK